jgi:muramoyltetrapeptide carboxypeptidase LdcA involved in peptidoglycan recycling
LAGPRDYTDNEKQELEHRIITVVKGEFGNSTLPIVANVDFGHTDPQVILPLGVEFEIDCQDCELRQVERAFA